jgi:ferredoxin-NADP reductase
VLLAGANVWGMLHVSRGSTGHAVSTLLIRAHRIGGYAFVFLFCAMGFFMALRLKGVSEELPPRIILHVVLALLLAPILLVKVLIARYYRQYSAALLPLGVTIFALSFTLVSMNLVPYVLGRAGRERVPASLSGGFLLTLCIGLGFVLLRRPRQKTPAVSTEARPIRIRLQLARIDVQTHDARTLRFLLVDQTPLSARPGQFLTFQWRIDGKLVPRSYSICSSPAQTAYVEITPKRVPNGRVSSFLNERAAVGLEVEASGPFGRFCLDEARHRRVVLIAGGSGITPMMSMLRYIDDRCLGTPVLLLYCVRTRNDVMFQDELRHLSRRLPNLRVVVVLSRPDATWNGPRGRLSRDVISAHVEDLRASTVFLCGPPPFMESVEDILGSLGVEPASVKRESFGATATSGATTTAAEPQLQGRVEFSRSGKVCGVARGETLLEVAEMHGVRIAFGCRQGRCGTCRTKLIDGDVAMDVEEGLESSDKAEGYILMCVARPRGDVKIDA